jgi:hypothetical protein
MKPSLFNAKRFAAVTAVGVLLGIGGFLAPVKADWNPGDPYKMHYPQLPDPFGWDVNFTDPKILADDWLCTETGPVADIHFWLSFRQDIVVPIQAIRVSIHSDIPDPDGPTGPLFSMPGELLWAGGFSPSQFTIRDYGTGQQGWFDPNTGEYIRPDHFRFYQVNIQNILDPFIQEAGKIYWLDLSVLAGDPGTTPLVGWKTSRDHFNDDAVWADYDATGNLVWNELRDPITGESLDMAFVITVPEPGTWALLALGGLALFAWKRQRRS